MKKYDAMDYFKALTTPNSKTIDLRDEDVEDQFTGKPYWFTLKFLSQFEDSILYANEINIRPYMDNRLKLDFFINTLRPRFRKVGKATYKTSDDIDLIMKYYNYNESKAKSVLNLFDDESLNELKRLTNEGGLKNERNIRNDGGGDISE